MLYYSKYTEISSVDHLWVSRLWIRDLGLSQYSSVFEANMVDGRMLNALTRKDMEKYLNVSKKFYQVGHVKLDLAEVKRCNPALSIEWHYSPEYALLPHVISSRSDKAWLQNFIFYL